MDHNLIGYAIYLLITVVIIWKVGDICYKNGNILVAELAPGHEEICKRLNKLLLVGYYLLNIGYCLIAIVGWKTIGSSVELVEAIASKSSLIICIIAAMHYFNIFIIRRYIGKIIHSL